MDIPMIALVVSNIVLLLGLALVFARITGLEKRLSMLGRTQARINAGLLIRFPEVGKVTQDEIYAYWDDLGLTQHREKPQ